MIDDYQKKRSAKKKTMGNNASSSSSSLLPLPPSVDLREYHCFPYPSAYDQKDEGTCVAQAISTALTCAQRNQNLNVLDSKYYDADSIFASAVAGSSQKNDEQQQQRRELREGITFDEGIRTVRPEIRSHHSVHISVANFKYVLAEKGLPIVLGFALTTEMYAWQERLKNFGGPSSSRALVLPFSPRDAHHIEGYHCVLVVGYDDALGAFVVRNSWGKQWGDEGHFLYPYDLIANKTITLDAVVIET